MSVAVSGTNHPTFFNGRILAEVLDNGLYRFTRKERNNPPVSLVVNPLAGHALLEVPGSKDRDVILNPMAPSQSECGDFFREGEALLREKGAEVKESKLLSDELHALRKSLQEKPAINPEDLRPGDHVGVLFEDHLTHSTGFYLAELVKRDPENCPSGTWIIDDRATVVYDQSSDAKQINYDTAGLIFFVRGDKVVRIDADEHRWLKHIATLHQDPEVRKGGKGLFLELFREFQQARFEGQWTGGVSSLPVDSGQAADPNFMGDVFV